MVQPSILILFQKSWTVPCWFFKPLSEKTARWKSLHYHQNDRELAVITFLVFSRIPSEGEITSKSRSWSWIALETQYIFDEHYWNFFKENRIICKTKNALLFEGKLSWNFENPVSQRKSEHIVLKCFGRKFARSFRTKAAKDSRSFISLTKKGPKLMEAKSKEETTLKWIFLDYLKM